MTASVLVEPAIAEARAGTHRYLAASRRDLSECRQVARERRAAAPFLQALDDHQTDIVIRSDPGFVVQFCHQAAARFFGVARAGLIGQRFPPVSHHKCSCNWPATCRC